MKIAKIPPEEPTFTLTLTLNEMRALVHLAGFGDDATNDQFRRLMAALVAAIGETFAVAKASYNRNTCFRDV